MRKRPSRPIVPSAKVRKRPRLPGAALGDDVDAAARALARQPAGQPDAAADARPLRGRGVSVAVARAQQRHVAVGGEADVVDVRGPGELVQPRRVRRRAVAEAALAVGRDVGAQLRVVVVDVAREHGDAGVGDRPPGVVEQLAGDVGLGEVADRAPRAAVAAREAGGDRAGLGRVGAVERAAVGRGDDLGLVRPALDDVAAGVEGAHEQLAAARLQRRRRAASRRRRAAGTATAKRKLQLAPRSVCTPPASVS